MISWFMLLLNMNMLTLQPFKSHVSVAAQALLNLNAHCVTMHSLSDKKDVHLMGQCCPSHLLKV
jgi:hypothetical protein